MATLHKATPSSTSTGTPNPAKNISKNFGKSSKSSTAARRSKIPRTGTKPTEEKAAAPIKRRSLFYSSESSKLKTARKTATSAKLRGSITPGTVLILLAGRFRGKRVVFLKQLASGLLLVSGPFKVNGVPLKRVNQAYVIATSTKVDVSSVKVDDKINDSYFTKEASKRSKGSEKEFFGKDKSAEKEKKAFPSDKAEDQKTIDKALIAEIQKTENLAKYLGSSFGLSKGQFPHQLKF